MYFSLDVDGDVLAARPTPLVEVRPQPGVLRHTAAHIVDVVPMVQIVDAPVPQMGDQLVEVLQKIDTLTPVQVIEVPKIFQDRLPQRFVEGRPPQKAEQLVEVPTEPAFVGQTIDTPVLGGGGRRGRKRRTRLWPKLERRPGQGSTAFHGAEHLEIHGLQVYPQDRVLLRFVEQNMKLMLVYAQDRAPQRLVDHTMDFSRDRALWSRTSRFSPEVEFNSICWSRTPSSSSFVFV